MVIKIGSAVLSDGTGFDQRSFLNIVNGVVSLRRSGIDVTVVCSGAVALGRAALGLSERPKKTRVTPGFSFGRARHSSLKVGRGAVWIWTCICPGVVNS